MVLQTLFGDKLLKSDGSGVETSSLSTIKNAVTGIYVSANWCPPCKTFTPKLATVYNEIRKLETDFEIVFCSWDSDEESFKSYHKEMPWLAIPYDKDKEKDALRDKYSINGIPSLIFVESDTGNIITTEGRDLVEKFGANGFPFTADHLSELRESIRNKNETLLSEMADMKFLGKLSIYNKRDEEVDLHKATKESEALAIAFMGGLSLSRK